MKKIEECAVCAWRKECKMKFTFERSGLNCKDFTRDVTLSSEDKRDGADKKVVK